MKHQPSEYEICCTTETGRKRMVARIEQLAQECGATVELHEFNGPREIGLELIFGPYQCMMHFCGEEARRLGVFMGHWHTSLSTDAKYPETFWRVGSLNTFHYGKATTIESTLPGFLQKLRDGLAILKERGESFEKAARELGYAPEPWPDALGGGTVWASKTRVPVFAKDAEDVCKAHGVAP